MEDNKNKRSIKPKRKKLLYINRIFSSITVFLFCSFICIIGFLFFIIPKQTVSEVERRELTKKPEFSLNNFFSGKYTDNYSLYYSDNFVFREKFVKMGFSLEEKRGLRIDDIKIYDDGASSSNAVQASVKIVSKDTPLVNLKASREENPTPVIGEEQIPDRVYAEITNESEYADLTKEDLRGEQRGPLFMIGDTALEIFYGNSNVAKDYANTINAFRKSLPQNIRIFDAVIPSHFEFGLPSKYHDTVGKRQKPFIDEIYSNLDSGISAVDAYSEIQRHYNKGEYLYFRSDHHWTALGAYYAYKKFALSAGFEPIPIENYEKGRIEKFLGTFYSGTYDKNLASYPDYVDYYKPFTDYKMLNYREDGVSTYEGTIIYESISSVSSGYLVFTGGDIPCAEVTTSNNSGRSIIVFKESYGNAFVPFLLAHYDKVIIADIRTFPFDAISYITENNITDVLFLNNIMTSCTPARVMNIINLLK